MHDPFVTCEICHLTAQETRRRRQQRAADKLRPFAKNVLADDIGRLVKFVVCPHWSGHPVISQLQDEVLDVP